MKKLLIVIAFLVIFSNLTHAETINTSDPTITLDTDNLTISVQNQPLTEQSKQEVTTTRSRFC